MYYFNKFPVFGSYKTPIYMNKNFLFADAGHCIYVFYDLITTTAV